MKNKLLKSIPNLFTGTRIILVIIAFILLLNNSFNQGIILLIIAALTDFFDGFLARKFNAISILGAKLDQLSDKLFEILICFAAVILGNHYLLINLLLELFFSIVITHKSNKIKHWAISSVLGKTKTAVLFLMIIFGIIVTEYKYLEIPFFIVWSIGTIFQIYTNYDNLIKFKNRLNINNSVTKKK